MLWLKDDLPSRRLIVYRAMMLMDNVVCFICIPTFYTINYTSSLLQLCCAVYLRRWLCVNQSLIE